VIASTAWILASGVTGCGPQNPPMPPDGAPPSVPDVFTPPGSFVPYIAGEFTRVYTPPGTRYLNDHTVVRGPDGRWHVYGITDESIAAPFEENEFLHAVTTTTALFGAWEAQPDILVASSEAHECCLWAPHAVSDRPGHWVMYYYSDFGSEGGGLRRADSTDLVNWTRATWNAVPAMRPPGGRDPCLLRDGDVWRLYSVGVSAAMEGRIVMTESRNLDDPSAWSPARTVIMDPVPDVGWGNLESPFVVVRGGLYYLFLTRTGINSFSDYERTEVFRSNDPAAFRWEPITTLHVHAGEVITDVDGQDYITSAGWTHKVGDRNRGLSIAPIRWAPQ
jgi:arabinan endo-1,5-alpha-L-arabinosidase